MGLHTLINMNPIHASLFIPMPQENRVIEGMRIEAIMITER